MSIERYGKKLLAAHCEKLERLYLAAPCNEHYDPGVRISGGEAEIVIPMHERFAHVMGAVHASLCFTAMADSAALAVNSIVEKALVAVVDFDIHLTHPIAAAELMARGRFLGMSANRYLAESVLMDLEGKEIGRGNGAFVESDVSLSSDMG